MRSKVLDHKNNGQYNILTGVERGAVPVPSHPRYNPIASAAASIVGSNRSRRSGASAAPPQ